MRSSDDTPPIETPLLDAARRAEVVDRFAHVGGTCLVADDRGLCLDLRVKVVAGDVFVASASSDRLRLGARLAGRVFSPGQVEIAVFVIEEIEETSVGHADGLLRLVDVVPRGDERNDVRWPYDAEAVAVPAAAFSPMSELRATPLRICEVSASGLTFLSDRRFDPWESADVAFTDEAGATIHARIQVVRAERSAYGRTSYAARVMAIGEVDQIRLDRLCSRCRLVAETAVRTLARNGGSETMFRGAGESAVAGLRLYFDHA